MSSYAAIDSTPVERGWLYYVLTVLAFLLLNLQMVTPTGIADASGAAIKLYHVAIAGLLLWALARGAVVRWRPEVILYFVVVTATGLTAYFVFGVRAMLVNYVFAACVTTVGAMLGAEIGGARSVRALRIVAGVMLFAVIAKSIVYAPILVAFLVAPFGHPVLPVFYGGGVNLEASWIALGSALFLRTRYFYPYALASMIISVVYASRSAVILVVLAVAGDLLYKLFQARVTHGMRIAIAAGSVVGSLGLLITAAVTLGGAPGVGHVVERFSSIGDEPGSTGRLTLWSGGVRVFAKYPLGVGQGNAVDLLEREIGESVPEDSLHNVFLQHLVDSGIQGFLVYLLFCAMTALRLVRSRFRNTLLLYVCIYLVVGAIQFRGVDAIFWFVYGLEMGNAKASPSA